MNEIEHTIEPWEIERPCAFPYTGIFIVSHKANEQNHFHSFIAEIRQYRNSTEAEANAKLIIAAPNLLKACKMSLPWFKNMALTPQVQEQIRLIEIGIARTKVG